MTQTARAARRGAQAKTETELPLPTTWAEWQAIVNNEDEDGGLRAYAKEYGSGKVFTVGATLKAEEDQLQAQEAAKSGQPRIRSLNLGPDGGPGAGGKPAPRNPLAYSAQAMQAIQAGIDMHQKFQVEHDMTEQRWQVFNAALTTTTLGHPREWAASVLPGPRILHVSAGVTQVPSDAVEAEHAKLALPTATAASAEAATLAEYSSSTAGTVTLGRFGRFTDLSTESLVGTNAEAIVRMHQLGIAKDLDSNLITKVEADAGSAVAFNDPVPDIRTHIATLVDATAAEDPSMIVILAHPDDVHLLEDVTPTGGVRIAEAFQRFSGALVYPSAAVTTGFMTVCNLAAGALFFEARGVVTETDADVKTGVRSVATSHLGGYGTGAIGSYAIKQDVVTP